MATRILPIFPLPLVLFPGATIPLHIFEERYKLMVRTVLREDSLFGINLIEPLAGKAESELAEKIGCSAEISLTAPLDDGRINILTIGRERYRIVRFTETDPYNVAEVEFFDDAPEQISDADETNAAVRREFLKLSEIVKSVNNEALLEGELPNSPRALSLLVASAVPIENQLKQGLLELTSTSQRLKQLLVYLKQAINISEYRLVVQKASRTNGHAGKLP